MSSDPLVSAEWLKDHISAPDIRVIDATWVPPWSPEGGTGAGRKVYLQGHIPGAVYFDIDEIADETSPYPHMLPTSEKFSSRARKLGLGDGKTLIVYDRTGYMASARVWWMFRLMGHKDIKVLDGGWEAWLKAGGAVEDMEPIVSDRHFTVRIQNQLLKTYDQMLKSVADGNECILDARPAGRFLGKDAEPRAGLKSGAMPGANNIPSSSLISSDGTLKSAEELGAIFGSNAERADITATCGSGVTAAVIALALCRLGREDVAVYDGSWSEWASQSDAPIVTA